jgi:hypothetical protein
MIFCPQDSRSVAPESHGFEAHDQWFADLLRRYIGATGAWSKTDLQHASVGDIREVVITILAVLTSSEGRRK